MKRSTFLRAALLPMALGLGLPAVQANPAAYPQQPIKLVVPFPPGGATDVSGRLLGKRISEILQQPVIIENKPGGGSNIGAAAVAKAPADGYTLLLGTSAALAVNKSLYKDMQFDPHRDFKPVVLTTVLPCVVVVHKDRGINSVQQLNEHLKQNGAKAFYASPGNGTPPHLGTELYKRTVGVQAAHVPYKGGAPALQDMVANRADFMIAVLPEALPLIRGGQLKALAVTTKQRLSFLPDVPTVSESGVPGFEVAAWYGIVAPANTPDAVVQKLNAALNQALKDPAIHTRLTEMGFHVAGGSSKELGDLMQSEYKKWSAVVKDANITID